MELGINVLALLNTKLCQQHNNIGQMCISVVHGMNWSSHEYGRPGQYFSKE